MQGSKCDEGFQAASLYTRFAYRNAAVPSNRPEKQAHFMAYALGANSRTLAQGH
jgi:hypothetical protein